MKKSRYVETHLHSRPISGAADRSNDPEGVTADETGNVFGAKVARRTLRRYRARQSGQLDIKIRVARAL